VIVGSESNWVAVSAGSAHTIAFRRDGTVWTWGQFRNGELGDSRLPSRTALTRVGFESDWMAVAAGTSHSLGIKTNGTLWSWGNNSSYQLGLGSSTDLVFIPTQVGTDTNWSMVSSGNAFSLGLKRNRTLWGWGLNDLGALGSAMQPCPPFSFPLVTPTQIRQESNWFGIASGKSFILIMDSNRVAYSQGDNSAGQLGQGSVGNQTLLCGFPPFQMPFPWGQMIAPVASIPPPPTYSVLSAGSEHSLGIATDGRLYGWGNSRSGQLGVLGGNVTGTPTQVGVARNWRTLTAGWNHTLVVNSNNILFACGDNTAGQLGMGPGTNRFTLAALVGSWSTIAGGGRHSLGTRTDGTLWGWGENSSAQLGRLDISATNQPVQIGSASDWRLVVTGGSHSLAIKADGSLWGCGDNSDGRVGDTSNFYPRQTVADSDWRIER